jgi:hypothetical protein
MRVWKQKVTKKNNLVGSGKSSLIRSIVQACDDIVHVDPMPALSSGRSGSKSGARHTREGSPVPIAEIYASTKPYPSWWSDLENSRVLRRRKSYGDAILERNLCFVDTLHGTGSRAAQTQVIAHYMGQQWLRAMTAVNAANFDLEGMLGGDGGSQVDAVLYLISEGMGGVKVILQLKIFHQVMVGHQQDLTSQ